MVGPLGFLSFHATKQRVATITHDHVSPQRNEEPLDPKEFRTTYNDTLYFFLPTPLLPVRLSLPAPH